MTITPAPVDSVDWLDMNRASQPESGATSGIVKTVFPWHFEELVALPHDIDPSTGERPEGQLSREQAALLGEILGNPHQVTIAVWVGSPTRLRADAAGFARWEARPHLECFVGVASLADLIEAQPSSVSGRVQAAETPDASAMSGREDYVHHFGGSTMDPLSVPCMWWSADEEWLVLTDVDLPFTLIGCTVAVAELLRERAGAIAPVA